MKFPVQLCAAARTATWLGVRCGVQGEPDELQPEDLVREAPEIARRALALFAVVGLALRAPKEETIAWLKRESLWEELTPEEFAYVSASSPTERQAVNASWRSEALLMLLWALAMVEELPGLSEQCDAAKFQAFLPPFADVSVEQFISSARRRDESALVQMADALLHSHWEARDALVHDRALAPHLDVGIIQERHHAINWVIGYDGLPWDEITTDT